MKGAPSFLFENILKRNMCALIKLPVPNTINIKLFEELFEKYQSYLETTASKGSRGEHYTNETARHKDPDTNAFMLYNINTTDPINIKIISKSQFTNLSSGGLTLRKITPEDYDDAELTSIQSEETRNKIQEQLSSYFKDKNVLYLVANNNRFAISADGINSKIGHICSYNATEKKFISGSTALPGSTVVPGIVPSPNLIPSKSFKSASDTECRREPIVTIEYKPNALFKSVTPAVLALLAVEHLKAQINPPAK